MKVNVTKIPNLPTNGFVRTSESDGTLSVSTVAEVKEELAEVPVIISTEEPTAENGSLWVNPEESFEMLNLYELAVENGFVGTLSEYLDSLQGGSQNGVELNYRDVIPQGNPYCKELGAHHGITPINPDTDPLPRTEFEDCSQIYNPKVIVVGDYYFMYYAGNTQKYKTNSAASEPDRKKSDFGRVDRVFLAYRKVSEGLHGPWQKWEDGRTPVLDISDFDASGFDRGNAWLRNVIYDGSQYVMAYTGDGVRDGSAHTYNPGLATSPDGINWTKLGNITTSGFNTNNFWMLINVGSVYYAFINQGTTIRLFKNTSLATTGWTSVGTISSTYRFIWNAQIINSKVYIAVYKSTEQDKVYLLSTNIADIETMGSYVEDGVLITGSTLFGESYNGSAPTPPTLNYNSIVYEGNNKWTVFYSYYKSRMARFPWVPETGIRSTSFINTIPIPQP